MTQPNDFNRQIIDYFRANGGKGMGPFEGRDLLLLTTTGAKSGRQQTTPLVYSRDGDRVFVAASMGGAPRNPAWYHNLVANPEVTVELGSEKFRAHASVAQNGERDRLYKQHADAMPAFYDYEKKTTRRIPVVILERQA